MKPGLKKARITFVVLTSILFACWAALIVVFVILFGKDNPNPSTFIKDMLSQLGSSYAIPPVKEQFIIVGGIPAPVDSTLLDTILTYSLTGVFGILALVTLITSIAKKRFGFITYAIFIALFAFAGVFTGAYVSQFFGYFKAVDQFAYKILLYATFGTGCAVALFDLILAIIVPCSIVSKSQLQEYLDEEEERENRIAAGIPSVPAPEFVPEPEPKEAPLSKFELANLIREIVRDEVARSELSRPQPQPAAPVIVTTPAPAPAEKEVKTEEQQCHSRVQTVTGATFGGPLVVQYFYGIAPTAAPQPQPEVKAEPAPAPVVEEPTPVVEEPTQVEELTPVVEEPTPVVEEPTPVEEPAPVVVEPAPVVEQPAPVLVVEETVETVVPVEAKAPIIRIPFEERIVSADKVMKDNYNTLKNEILSYGVKSRISNSGDTFRLHRKTYVKITIAGKSLKLYFALDPKDYQDSTIPYQDAGEKNSYAEIPFVFKVKSELSMKRAKQLIQDVMEKDGLEQGVVESVNWVKEIKASLKADK